MPRPKNPVPTYKHHKPTNTDRSWVNGEWVSLGRWNSPESRQAHARICAELAVAIPVSAVSVRAACAAPDAPPMFNRARACNRAPGRWPSTWTGPNARMSVDS